MTQWNPTFFNRNVPDELQEKVKAYAAAGERLVCVALPPAEGNHWSVVTNQTFFNRGISDECHEKMREFEHAGNKILCVAFPPAGGNRWTVITDKTFFNRGVRSASSAASGAWTAASRWRSGGMRVRSSSTSWNVAPPAVTFPRRTSLVRPGYTERRRGRASSRRGSPSA